MIKKENVIQMIDDQLERLSADIFMGEDAEAILLVLRNKVSNMPEEDDWIPCSERLPEEYGEYLCCDAYGNYIIGFPYQRLDDSFYVETDNEFMDDVIAWQPLPEQYKPPQTNWKDSVLRTFLGGDT